MTKRFMVIGAIALTISYAAQVITAAHRRSSIPDSEQVGQWIIEARTGGSVLDYVPILGMATLWGPYGSYELIVRDASSMEMKRSIEIDDAEDLHNRWSAEKLRLAHRQ